VKGDKCIEVEEGIQEGQSGCEKHEIKPEMSVRYPFGEPRCQGKAHKRDQEVTEIRRGKNNHVQVRTLDQNKSGGMCSIEGSSRIDVKLSYWGAHENGSKCVKSFMPQ